MTSAKEFAKLKKRLVHAVERLDSYREADLIENEQLETRASSSKSLPDREFPILL